MSSLSVTFGSLDGPKPPQPEPETPFEIWVLGDFAGRASRGASDPPSLGKRSALLVDRDNLGERFARLDVRCGFSGPREALELSFSEPDALHPDVIYAEVQLFEHLRGLRRRLANPDTFRDAAAELGAFSPAAAPAAPEPPPPAEEADPEGSADLAAGSLLDAAISATPDTPPASGVEGWLEELVAPFVLPAPDPRRDTLIEAVDEASAALLRRLLADPAFRALEARWLALGELVHGLETDRHLKIRLVDVTASELAADLDAGAELSATGAYELLVERACKTPGAPRPALVVTDMEFGSAPAELARLGRLGTIAGAAGALFVAQADGELVHALQASSASTGSASETRATWDALRASRAGSALALTYPRTLLRLPYGRRGGTVEAFPFEEIPAPHDPAALVWGGAAFALARVLGDSFSRSGWALEVLDGELDRLPLYVYSDDDGDSQVQSCGEVLLTEREAEGLASEGLIPVRAAESSDRVRLAPLRTLGGTRLGSAWL